MVCSPIGCHAQFTIVSGNASYNRALDINPQSENVWYNKACIYALKEEIKLALKYLEKAIKLNPKYLQMAKTDSDFDLIRDSQEFQTLINK